MQIHMKDPRIAGCLGRWVQPDLLIGADYFTQFKIKARDQLASGLHLWPWKPRMLHIKERQENLLRSRGVTAKMNVREFITSSKDLNEWLPK